MTRHLGRKRVPPQRPSHRAWTAPQRPRQRRVRRDFALGDLLQEPVDPGLEDGYLPGGKGSRVHFSLSCGSELEVGVELIVLLGVWMSR